MKAFKPHAKKCRNTACRKPFQVETPMAAKATWCSTDCAMAILQRKREKAKDEKEKRERREYREAKEQQKSPADHAKVAQDAFNAWVRERDHGKPCISCGTRKDVQYAAGHYRSVGACKELRFEPLNVHRQCNRNCNSGKSGNIVEYRIGLVKKIGLDKVEWLEGPHEPKRYREEDYKAITAKYRALRRELVKARERGDHGQS